jgi:kynureninase
MSLLPPHYLEKARRLDAADPLKQFRDQFKLPAQQLYLCNNSLGLPAKAAFAQMQEQMLRWSERGVEGWFDGTANWYNFQDSFLKKTLSTILGAQFAEVEVMNSLTVNLHLLLHSFYRPDKRRYKIVMDAPAFPSDLYAIKSHIRQHGRDPSEALILLEPLAGQKLEELLATLIDTEGEQIALLFVNPVNFLTGQALDMQAIAQLAKNHGCLLGCDIAHAAGNIPLQLHAWGVDFAVGCSYKYLCSGPGGPGIAYVHAAHHDKELPRLAGWWGNDPAARFQMQLQPEFIPYGGANSWQVSTPSILSMIPLAAALEQFEAAGMLQLRQKSEQQTAFLLELLEQLPAAACEVLTPKNPAERGAQLSLLIRDKAELRLQELEKRGVVCDFRPPNIIRVTPSPFYTSFEELYEFACRLKATLGT